MRNNKNGFSLIKLLLGLVAIVFIILFVLWVAKKNLSSINLNPLFDGIFRDNINSMQDAGEAYFTTDRLPKELNESVKLTLEDLLKNNYILPFTDKNGKECSLNESYVSVVKTAEGYELRTFLKCGDESHQLVKILGCHNLCEGNNCGEKVCTVEKVTQYQFVKTNKVTKDVYNCKEGTLNGKQCVIEKTPTVKTNTNTDVKPATEKVVSTEKEYVDSIRVDLGTKLVYTDPTKVVETTCKETTIKDPNCKVTCVPTYANGVLENVCNTCGYVKHKTCTDTDKWVCPNGYDPDNKQCYKEVPNYTYKCPDTISPNNQSGSDENLKCWYYKTEKTLTCDTVAGYELKNGSCYKTTVTQTQVCEGGFKLSNNICTKTVDAILSKKTTTSKVYKWSKEETLSGWTRTGKTKEVLGKEVCE